MSDDDQAAAILAGIISTFGECAEVHPEKQLPMATFILGAIRKGEVPGVWYNQQIATERDALRHERDHLLEKAKEYEGRAIGERCRADKAVAKRDRLADALRAVTDAYRFRFDVPGRGLCGPIDSEIEAAVAALAEAGK